jgi:hypothetical protein
MEAVCVTVIEVMVGVCRQEHTNATSDDGRVRMLEKTLALTVGIVVCLFWTSIGLSDTVVVLGYRISILTS